MNYNAQNDENEIHEIYFFTFVNKFNPFGFVFQILVKYGVFFDLF
jgi:hypothetical protein